MKNPVVLCSAVKRLKLAGFYGDGDYDVAGFAMGIVDKPRLLTGENIKAGDVLLGLPSSGVHSNGFSLVRKIVFDHKICPCRMKFLNSVKPWAKNF